VRIGRPPPPGAILRTGALTYSEVERVVPPGTLISRRPPRGQRQRKAEVPLALSSSALHSDPHHAPLPRTCPRPEKWPRAAALCITRGHPLCITRGYSRFALREDILAQCFKHAEIAREPAISRGGGPCAPVGPVRGSGAWCGSSLSSRRPSARGHTGSMGSVHAEVRVTTRCRESLRVQFYQK
jgi:hypothetical protein